MIEQKKNFTIVFLIKRGETFSFVPFSLFLTGFILNSATVKRNAKIDFYPPVLTAEYPLLLQGNGVPHVSAG